MEERNWILAVEAFSINSYIHNVYIATIYTLARRTSMPHVLVPQYQHSTTRITTGKSRQENA